jgi:prophage antirepressor-like protein
MTQKQQIQLFEAKKVRTVWDDEQEKLYFSIIDVCWALAESKDYLTARKYWNKLKQRLKEEGNETVTNCHQLKMKAWDGKMRATDVADTEQLFRLVQSIPSPKAEPFKQWMAQVAAQRIDQMQDPELNFEQAYADYRRLGYSDKWINQRLRSIEVRKELTDEWDRAGVTEGQQYASLTDIITHGWSGKTTKQYKQFKGLHKENLRDNMTNIELALNTLAEASATEISKAKNPKGFKQSAEVARQGSKIAGDARKKLEAQVGHSVISPSKASDYLPPAEDVQALPVDPEGVK